MIRPAAPRPGKRSAAAGHRMDLPMPLLPRGALALILLAGCAGDGRAPSVATLPADATLDARSLGRGGAAARPATVQVQDEAGRPAILYTVSPRLQTGSATSLPMVVASFGAERQRADGAVAYRVLIIVSNARRHAGFSGAATRQGESIAVQPMGRETRCGGPGGCLYEETLLLTVPGDVVRRLAAAGQPLRLRLMGSAAYVEAAVPAGHLAAAAEATGGAAAR